MTLDLLQWPAMLATAAAAWAVGSLSPQQRKLGFWCFLFSNALWTVWGIAESAYGVVMLQFVLAVLNIRGARRAETAADADTTTITRENK